MLCPPLHKAPRKTLASASLSLPLRGRIWRCWRSCDQSKAQPQKEIDEIREVTRSDVSCVVRAFLHPGVHAGIAGCPRYESIATGGVPTRPGPTASCFSFLHRLTLGQR